MFRCRAHRTLLEALFIGIAEDASILLASLLNETRLKRHSSGYLPGTAHLS